MSAFICSDKHFKFLAAFAVSSRGSWGGHEVDPRYVKGFEQFVGLNKLDLANAYANLLKKENYRSVNNRYSERGRAKKIVMDWQDLSQLFDPVTIIKQCHCLQYQSNETKNYSGTKAYRLTQVIESAATRYLPGYEEAPWGI